jgi:hypothetical protein
MVGNITLTHPSHSPCPLTDATTVWPVGERGPDHGSPAYKRAAEVSENVADQDAANWRVETPRLTTYVLSHQNTAKHTATKWQTAAIAVQAWKTS